MHKVSQNVRTERECTSLCKSIRHSSTAISAVTKRGVTDRELISYLSNLCCNIGKLHDNFGRTVLHLAASCGRSELLLWLIAIAKANINARDFESGYTPLHRSVFYGHIHTTVQLMKLGADFHLLDNEDLTPIGMVTKDRPELVTLSVNVPCQVYVWGDNNNNHIGTGTGNSRKHPELLNQFKQLKFVSITQATIEEFHSVFVSSCGRVWSCGHGQGGRLGTNNEKHALIPVLLRLPEPCVKAQIALNHSLFLLSSGAVLSCGLNTHYQLGVHPYTEHCLKPHPVHFTSLKLKIQGLCAAKYHSVFYTTKEIYTCGLNAGQLGHSLTNSSFINVPTKVPLQLNEGTITHVASSCGAVVIASNNGHIYNLHQFQCRKIASKQLDVVQISVYGGKLESKLIAETGEDLKILILNSSGGILLWEQGFQQLIRCVFGIKRNVSVSNIHLTQQHIFFTTKVGEAFQGTIKIKEKSLGKTVSESRTGFHRFLEVSECYHIQCKKLQNIHRAVAITSDTKGKNFAVIQASPNAALTEIPVINTSERAQQLEELLEETSESDNLHDVVFNVDGQLYPAHRYMISLENSLLSAMAQNGGTVPIEDIDSTLFKQVLLYLYTGHCDLFNLGPLHVSVGNLNEDPVKSLHQIACKLKILSLIRKLQTLRFQNGWVVLKDGCSMEKSEMPKMGRDLLPEFYDIKLQASDGIIIDAHKCVLAARLQYFQSMLMGGWAESDTSGFLKLPYTSAVLKDIIDFIYTENIPSSVSAEDLEHSVRLLIVADQLLMNTLKEACEIALTNALSLRNAAVILQFSFTYNTEQLKRAAMNFIHLNLNAILESRTMEVLEEETLQELSKYHREQMSWKYDKRLITPFSNAPTDEEVKEVPIFSWPDEFDETEDYQNEDKKKKTPQNVSKRRSSRKISTSISEDHKCDAEMKNISPIKTSEPTPIILTPPPSPEKVEQINENLQDAEQFPSLSSSIKKKIKPKGNSDIKLVIPPKLSQKQRKKLEMEDKIVLPPPKVQTKGWATLDAHPTDKDSETNACWVKEKFTDIMASEKQERHNWTRMKTKSFTLTQLEDKAMEELMEFYNATNVFDERIIVSRVLPTNVAKPTWITSHKQLSKE